MEPSVGSNKCVVGAIVVLAIVCGSAHGISCPARVRPQPGYTMGKTLPWRYVNKGDGFSLFSGGASAFRQDCCPSGKISNWTVGLTEENEWVGSVSAVCEDGTVLETISYSFNGTGMPSCNSTLKAPSSTVSIPNAAYTARASNESMIQLFGIGRPSLGITAKYFSCRPGMQPIGFGARSSCYSLVDFQVICAPAYTDNGPSATDIAPEEPNRNVLTNYAIACPADVQAVPEEGLGRIERWVDYYNASLPRSLYNPTYNSRAGYLQQDCCNRYQDVIGLWIGDDVILKTVYCRGVISNWTLIYSDIDTLGQISAQCSDGNILKPITYGFNESRLGDCDNLLADTYTMYTPSDGAYLYNANFTVDSFMNVRGFKALRAFQCPTGTSAVGYAARSACSSIAGLQVLCGVPKPLARTAPSPSYGPSYSSGPSLSMSWATAASLTG